MFKIKTRWKTTPLTKNHTHHKVKHALHARNLIDSFRQKRSKQIQAKIQETSRENARGHLSLSADSLYCDILNRHWIAAI